MFMKGETLYRGDRWGANPTQVATIPVAEALAFRRGMLAVAQGPNVEVVDLASGKRLSAKLDVAQVDYAELMWGSGGQCLVYGTMTTEGGAKSGKRHVELRVLDLSAAQATGELAIIGRVVLDDVDSVSLLRYNEDQKRLLLVPRGERPVFMEIRFYDVTSGQLVDTYPAEGQGDVLISPDGRYVLTEQFTDSGAQFALYDLQAQGEVRPQVWAHEKGAYSMFPFWSPDGRYIAYLLRRNGEGEDGPIEALGLWVLDTSSGQVRRIPGEDTALSSLVGWTPEGDYIVGRYEAEQGSHYYAVRPDGKDRRILQLSMETQVLGWMPLETAAQGAAVKDQAAGEADLSTSRLKATLGDPQAMAQVVAQFVRGKSGAEPGDLAAQVEGYLEQAGWPMDSIRPRFIGLADGVWAAQLPSAGIYLLQDGHAERLGTAQVMLQARLQEKVLGLVSATGEVDNPEPMFELLRPQEDGAWKVVWSSQGQRYWVVTDGVIVFAGEGLSTLQVVGTSFGLDAENQTWDECRACAHRRLTGTWVRQNDSYGLKTTLPADASPESMLWSMTARTPYALLHECIDRLSKGLAVDDLVAKEGVVDQIRDLGLLGKGRRFTPLQESANVIRFNEAQSQAHYLATVEGERIIAVEKQ